MNLIRYAIEHPVTVCVAVVMVVMAGIAALTRIPVQLTPNVDATVIAVTTRWEGASPQEIENEVVRRQEEKVKGASALRKMTSTCVQGEGSINLEFHLGTDKDAALREVANKLREVTGYPLNVDEPVIEASNPQDRDYIAWVVISTTDPDFDVRRLHDFCEDRVKPELERVEGISEINVLGGFQREMKVLVDPHRLAGRGITIGQLLQRLRRQNLSASAGRIAEGKRDIRVRSVGRYARADEIANTLISGPGDPVVRVRDVARVALDFKEPNRIVRSRGQTVLAINAQRETGSNVVAVMTAFRERLAAVQAHILPAEARRLGLKGAIELEQVYDQTIYIDQAVSLVTRNLWVGGSLAAIVLLAFLRSVRATLVIVVAIPISIVGTFVTMAALGRSLNVISLAGLAFAVGMVVDNAIVVLENIDRHRKMRSAASDREPGGFAGRATREVWGAILASTLTTLAVFIPVLTVQEEAGQLFRDISLAICAAVTLSLLVSITVIPTAASRLMRAEAHGDRRPGRPGRAVQRAGTAFSAAFGHLSFVLHRSWLIRPLLILVLTAAALVGSVLLMPPASYLPHGNRNLVFAMMFEPPGYNLAHRSRIGERIETMVRPYWEAGQGQAEPADLPPAPFFDMATGAMSMVPCPPVDNFFFVAIPQMMFMGAISAESDNVPPISALLNGAIQAQPGIRGFALQMPLFRTGSRGTGSGLQLEISGPDLADVSTVAATMLGRLAPRYGGYHRVRPDPINFDLPGPEVQVHLKPVEASDLGLTQQDINEAVQVFGDGAIIGEVLDASEAIDFRVQAANAESGDATALAQLPLATPRGRVVPLASVAEVVRTTAPEQIVRVEEQRSVSLQIDLPETVPLEGAMQAIRDEVDALRGAGVIPPAVRCQLAGSAAKLTQVKQSLLGAWDGFNLRSIGALVTSRMFLALIVVYLLMAALFESWLYPFVILFSVPAAAVGGFLGLRLVHAVIPSQQLDVLTMLGFVILIGIVVNNAILIVHQTLNLMRGAARVDVEGRVMEQLPPREAIAQSVRSRVRPIFMATLTSVGGMLPLVLFPGAGSELYRGLGSVVVGGLLLSTLFSLVLVPAVLSLVSNLQQSVGRRPGGAG